MRGFLKGLRCRPLSVGHDAIVGFWIAFSLLWATTEVAAHFLAWPVLSDPGLLVAIVILSAANAVRSAWRPTKVVVPLPLGNVSLEVLFGDIFATDGVVAIPVGEFFDSEIGQPVSPKSLHGILIEHRLSGGSKTFDTQIAKRLESLPSDRIDRPIGKPLRYPIGTTALIEAGSRRYLAFASTHTDPITCKASSDVAVMMEALRGLWRQARIDLNGDPLNVPLVGGYLAGVGLPPEVIVNLIVLSFLDESKRQVVTEKGRIVLTWDKLDKVDLREVAKLWGGA